MRIGFTGTQLGMTLEQKKALKKALLHSPGAEFHHGDRVGADAEAHAIAVECGLRPILHPPSDPKKRAFCRAPMDDIRQPKPYLDRNKDNIVVEADMLIAAPAESAEQVRSGTWSTVRYARRARRKIVLIDTDGQFVGGN